MISRRSFIRNLGTAVGTALLAPSQRTLFSEPFPVLRYPYVQNLRHDGVTILWTTSVDGTASVLFSDGVETRSVRATTRLYSPRTPYYEHRANLDRLAPGADYGYRVLLDGVDLTPGDALQFRTAGPGAFRFVAFGDMGAGTNAQSRVASLVAQAQPSLAVITGDLVYPYGSFEFYEQNYFGYYASIMKRVPFFPSPGNHDYDNEDHDVSQGLKAYLSVHDVPTAGVPAADAGRYYSFDWGNVHFVSLDTQESLLAATLRGGRMLEWLDADLKSTHQFWKVVYFHHPPYASGPNEGDTISAHVRAELVPILEKHDVPLVFNGHEHSYQRSEPIRDNGIVNGGDGIVYITTGGGGAELYPVFPSARTAKALSAHHFVMADALGFQISLRAIGLDGREFDSYTLAPAPEAASAWIVDEVAGPDLRQRQVVRISGKYLAAETLSASGSTLPPELGGTSVTIGGARLPLVSVSAEETKAILPPGIIGEPPVRILTPNGYAEAILRRIDSVEFLGLWLRIPSGELP